MTGKEALIILSKCCSALAFEEGKWEINKRDNEALQTLKEIVVKHDKYKKAFEILKDYSIIPPLEDFRYSEYTNCYFAEIEEYDHDYEDYRTIHYVLEKDEYELLEELMKDAKD